MSRLRRPTVLLAALLASGSLAACGVHPNEEARVQHIENEGLYLKLGELKYQVQGSRQLNPHDEQDRHYLLGLTPQQRKLAHGEIWFGVFLQAENESDRPLQPSADIQITDTQGNVFKPLPIAAYNVFAYRPHEPIPAGEFMPIKDSPAYDTPTRGALLLFKLTESSLDNRPLELKIEGSGLPAQTGIIDLDV